LLDLYFHILHPWTPIIHQTSFRKRVQDPQPSEGVVLIVKAIVAVTARFSNESGPNDPRQYAEQYRQYVILKSMEMSSFETVQALVLIAVDMVHLRILDMLVFLSDSTDWKRQSTSMLANCRFGDEGGRVLAIEFRG
jgi:hypothetical protein